MEIACVLTPEPALLTACDERALPAEDLLQLSLIEYTLRHTTLGDLRAGDRVHVEGDIIGKYVQRLAAPYGARAAG